MSIQLNRILTKAEYDRVVEFLEWGKSKGITDKTFLSALDKLVQARESAKMAIEQAKEKANDTQYLDGISKKVRDFITQEVAQGEKNRYHSIYAILKARADNGKLKDLNTELNEYLNSKRAKDKVEEYKEELTELFTYCYEKVSKNVKPYRYLDQLPQKAKRFVMNRIKQGSPSIYHSVMSYFGISLQKKLYLEDIETEFNQYMRKANKRHDFTEQEIPALKELFQYCYDKVNKGK